MEITKVADHQYMTPQGLVGLKPGTYDPDNAESVAERVAAVLVEASTPAAVVRRTP